MRNITVKNISSAMVIISAPNLRFRRELTPGRSVMLSEDEYDELSFDTGFNSLINGHFISVTNSEADAEDPVTTAHVFSVQDIGKMFDEQNITAFAKFLPSAAEAEKDTVVKLAVEKGITNSAFTALIKKYCGIDVINAINIKHQSEE